ncbi:MAG: glycosyltransferase family 39 protein [Candidatus Aureabacteria bacterium]|nr:glycosyltransferase family 39 protein [Candidatus Auribacterota bacterium]
MLKALALLASVASLAGIGMLAVRRSKDSSAPDILIDSLFAGSLIVSQLLFVLSLLGLLHQFSIIILFLLGIFYFVFFLRKNANGLLHLFKEISSFVHSIKGLSLFAAILACIALLIPFLAALYPPFFSDEISYHLLNARMCLEEKGLVPDVENPYTLFPISFEMLYAYSMGLWGDSLPKLLHWFFHVISVLLVFRIARKGFSSSRAVLCASIFSLTPVIAFYSATAFITSGVTAFFLASFDKLLDFLKKRNKRDFLLFCAYSFFLLVMHHSAVMFILSFIVIIVADRWKNRSFVLAGKKEIFKAGLLFLVISFPYYARNISVTSDPFYPVFASRLGCEEWNSFVDYAITRQFYFTKGMGRGILSLLLLPVNITFRFKAFSTLNHDMGIGPLYLLLIPLLIFLKGKKSFILRPITITSFFCILFWFFLMPHFGRFLFPVMALLCIPLGASIDELLNLRNSHLFLKAAGFFIAVAMTFNVITLVQTVHPSYLLLLVTGQFSDEDFLREVLGPEYLAAWFLNRHHEEKDGYVAFFKDFSPYYCHPRSYSFYTSPTLSQTFMTKERIAFISQSGYSGKELTNCSVLSKETILGQIKALGIRYMVISSKEKEKIMNENLDYIIRNCRLILKLDDIFIYELE